MGCWGAFQQTLLLGVAVEADDGAQPASDRRASTAASREVAGETLDVGPAHSEQTQVVLLAPGDELSQIQRVGIAGQAAVAGQERSQRVPLAVEN
jgi:hypothetical protein